MVTWVVSMVIVGLFVLLYLQIKQIIKFRKKVKFLEDVYDLKNQILKYMFDKSTKSIKKTKVIQDLNISNHDIYKRAIEELKNEQLIEETTNTFSLTSIGSEYTNIIYKS